MYRKDPPELDDGDNALRHQHWHYHGPADHHEHVHPDGFSGGHAHAHNHIEVSLGEFLQWLFDESGRAAGAAPAAGPEARAAGPEHWPPEK